MGRCQEGRRHHGLCDGALNPTSDEVMFAAIMDESGENYYPAVDAMTYSECLNNKSVEVGERKEGVVLFEVAEEAIGGTSPLYMIFNIGNQMLPYSVEQ